MKLLALLPLAALAADIVVASAVPARHHRIARALNRKKRCLARPHNDTVPYSSATSPQVTAPANIEQPPANYQQHQPPTSYQQPSSSTSLQQPPTPTPTNNPPAQPQSGSCGDKGATTDPTTTSGPNGSIYWLDCGIQDGGIQDGGWNPPSFTTDDVIAKDLSQAGDLYSPCQPYFDTFNTVAKSYNLPAILLAAIAMQESTCNADITGPNGEQGLMQITVEKCPGGYASDACKDAYYNIDAGAKYLRSTLDRFNGNLLQAVGTYNGWFKGMTYDDATGARSNNQCYAQNNLDYLHQVFNGWMQGVNPDDPYNNNDPNARMGVFFNLDGCK